MVFVLTVAFGVGVGALWTKNVGSRKTKGLGAGIRGRREYIDIDPASVPLFEPTCKSTR